MRTFALIHNNVITRLMTGALNPFHSSLKAVEVTGIPAQVGNSVDALGNVGPSIPMSTSDAAARRPSFVAGEAAYAASRGVWLPKGDPAGHRFDTTSTALGTLAALASAGSDHTPDVTGKPVEIPAKDVYAAAGEYLGGCIAWQAALQTDPDALVSEGWPDNGEPSDKPVTAPAAVAPDRAPGTGIVPEQTTDAPHADTDLEVAGTVEAPVIQST